MNNENTITLKVPCPYCGDMQEISPEMYRDLDYIWDTNSTCTNCRKMFVYVSRIAVKTYTVNIPDEDIP